MELGRKRKKGDPQICCAKSKDERKRRVGQGVKRGRGRNREEDNEKGGQGFHSHWEAYLIVCARLIRLSSPHRNPPRARFRFLFGSVPLTNHLLFPCPLSPLGRHHQLTIIPTRHVSHSSPAESSRARSDCFDHSRPRLVDNCAHPRFSSSCVSSLPCWCEPSFRGE